MAYGEHTAFQIDVHGRHAFSNYIALRASPFSDANSCWVNICKVGKWDGYSDGPVEFTAETFRAIIANASKLSTPISWDYEHQTFNPMSVGPKPSAGVTQKLELRGDELWAFVSWTPRAAQFIRDGEYRTCSVVIDPEHTDRVTGELVGPALLSVALTNDPFIDGLHVIQLSRSAAAMSAPAVAVDDKKPAADDKPPVQASADAPVEMASTDAPAADTASPDASAFISAAADTAGCSPDAALAILMDQMDAVVALLTANSGDGTSSSDGKPMSAKPRKDANVIEMRHLSKQVQALSAELANARAEKAAAVAKVQKESISEKVKTLVASGFVADGDQEDAIYLFTQDPVRAARVYSKQIVPLNGTAAGEDPNTSIASTESVTLAGMSEAEQATVLGLSQLFSEEDAKKVVVMTRGNKMTAAEAARKVRSDNAKKEAR